jgi:FdhD protein
MSGAPPAHCSVPVTAWRVSGAARGTRDIPEETAVALTYGRMTHAVMMATPADLEDFAVGFSLAERIIASPSEIEELEIVAGAQGIELRMSVGGGRMDALLHRRRFLTGATGCGLCGMESLAEAARAPPFVRGTLRVSADALAAAPAALAERQSLNALTHAVHAAGFWTETDGILLVREDVGRHNALDKLAGALARRGMDASRGVVVLTSRVSVEMVQKAAVIGSPIIMAVSAPTALALRVATEAGITLIGIGRGDGFELFTHPARIVLEAPVHVG